MGAAPADPGRFERPKTAAHARPDAASNFSLEHPQYGLRLEERVAAWRIEPTAGDRAAGLRRKNWRPASASDATILHHHEAPPAPPRGPRHPYNTANKLYIQEVEAAVAETGVTGDAVRSIVAQHVFGGGGDGRRPPSAPRNMLVGKPESRPSTAPPTPRAPPPTTPRRGAPAVPKVPLRQVSHTAAKALAASASIDYVRVNRRNAGLTPRRVQPSPRPSEWKMSRWSGVAPRVKVPPDEHE